MLTIDEASALFMTLTFTDENDLPIVPATVKWRLDDLTNGVEVKAWTALTPASTITFTISALDNAIAVQTNVLENREALVRVNEGLATQAHEHKLYRIENHTGAT